ncbi:hypothetical protein CABS03_14968 [Colletotrichum abscissum]
MDPTALHYAAADGLQLYRSTCRPWHVYLNKQHLLRDHSADRHLNIV